MVAALPLLCVCTAHEQAPHARADHGLALQRVHRLLRRRGGVASHSCSDEGRGSHALQPLLAPVAQRKGQHAATGALLLHRCRDRGLTNLNLRGGKRAASTVNGASSAKMGYSASDFATAAHTTGATTGARIKESREQEEARRKSRNKNKKILRKRQGKFVPSIKNRIRNIERTMQRKGHLLPEGVRQEMTTKLAHLQVEQEEAGLVEREKEMAKRYRRNKFFERKKLQRRLLQCTRDLETAATEEDRDRLQSQRRKLLEDIQYVLYYPRDMKYVSILKNPRAVIDELKSTPDFQAKMDRARQVVLAYRAMKLKQQQQKASGGAAAGQPASASDEEAESASEDEARADLALSHATSRKHSLQAGRASEGPGSDENMSDDKTHKRAAASPQRRGALRPKAERPAKKIKLGRVAARAQDDSNGPEASEASEAGDSGGEVDPDFTASMRREQMRNTLQVLKHAKAAGASKFDAPENEHGESDSESGHAQASDTSDSVKMFEANAQRPGKNPLAHVFGGSAVQGSEADQSMDPSASDSGSGRSKSGGILHELRGFAGEDEVSEAEQRRRKLSHARENYLGPGDMSSDSDRPGGGAADDDGLKAGDESDGREGDVLTRFKDAPPSEKGADVADSGGRRAGGTKASMAAKCARQQGGRGGSEGDVQADRHSGSAADVGSSGAVETWRNGAELESRTTGHRFEGHDDRLEGCGSSGQKEEGERGWAAGRDASLMEHLGDVDDLRHVSPSAIKTPKHRRGANMDTPPVPTPASPSMRESFQPSDHGEQEEGVGSMGRDSDCLMDASPTVLQSTWPQTRPAASGHKIKGLHDAATVAATDICGSRASASRESDAFSAIAIHDDSEGLTALRATTGPRGAATPAGVEAAAAGSGGSRVSGGASVVQTPDWKRVGRGKKLSRQLKRKGALSGRSEDLDGLDVGAPRCSCA